MIQYYNQESVLDDQQSCLYGCVSRKNMVYSRRAARIDRLRLSGEALWESVVVAADVAVKSADVQIGFMDRFCGTLILTGGLSQVETAVEAVVKFFKEELHFPVSEIVRS